MFNKETRVQDSRSEIIQELRPMAVVSLQSFMELILKKSLFQNILKKWKSKCQGGDRSSKVRLLFYRGEFITRKNTQPMNGSGRWCLRGSISQSVGERWVSCRMEESWFFLNESLELSALKGAIGISVSTGGFLTVFIQKHSRKSGLSQRSHSLSLGSDITYGQ